VLQERLENFISLFGQTDPGRITFIELIPLFGRMPHVATLFSMQTAQTHSRKSLSSSVSVSSKQLAAIPGMSAKAFLFANVCQCQSRVCVIMQGYVLLWFAEIS